MNLIQEDILPRQLAFRMTLLIAWRLQTPQNIAVIYRDPDHHKEIRQEILAEINSVPDWVRPKTVESNKDRIRTDFGSSIVFLPPRPERFRGMTVNSILWPQSLPISEDVRGMAHVILHSTNGTLIKYGDL